MSKIHVEYEVFVGNSRNGGDWVLCTLDDESALFGREIGSL